jgi:hypothetical protein
MSRRYEGRHINVSKTGHRYNTSAYGGKIINSAGNISG